MSDEGVGVSVTFKAGAGYDAPWIVLHGTSVDQVRTMALELAGSDLTDGVAQLARKFHGTYAGANPAASRPSQAPASTPQPQPSSAPPPGFVPNQQAQPAGWPQTPVQQLQQELGATVVSQTPNAVSSDIQFCGLHGNAERKWAPGGKNKAGKDYSESYRCPVPGCKPKWKQADGSWS